MVPLFAAIPVDPGLLLKLLGTLSTVVLGWIVSRAQPPRSGEVIFVGYHRGAIRALSIVTVVAVIACAASFWWAPPHLALLLLVQTLGLGAFTCYALRLGLVYTAEGMLIRGFFGDWRPQKWDAVELLEAAGTDVRAVLVKAGVAGDDWRQVLRRRRTI